MASYAWQQLERIPNRPMVQDQELSFEGGLNTTADDTQVAPNEVRRSDNCRLTEFGGITKRLGTRNLHTSALGGGNPVRGGYAWLRASGQQLLAYANGKLYTATYAAPPITFTDQGGTMSTSTYPSFAQFRYSTATEAVYIADGGPLNKWNGAALTENIANTPNVSRLAVYNQRLFGISGTNETLYFSELNDGDSLGYAPSGGGSANVITFGDQYITNIVALRSSLLIFHVSGISRFTGISLDDISIKAGAQGITSDVGTIAPESVVSTENAAYFLTDRGFYVATEYGVQPISQKIDKTIRTFDQTASNRVCAAHNRGKREIWWYLPDLGVFVYNYFLKAWSGPFNNGYVSPVTHALWEATDTLSKPIVLTGGASGFVKQGDYPSTYFDNVLAGGTGGTAFSMVVTPRRFFMGDLPSVKAIRWVYVQANLHASMAASVSWSIGTTSGRFTITADPDPTWGSGTWGTGTWGGGGDTEYRVPVGGQGPYVDLTFTDGGQTETVLSTVQVQGYSYGRRLR